MFEKLVTSATVFNADLYRNISTIRYSQNLFDDLSNNEKAWEVAMALEASTHESSEQSRITRPFEYGTVITHPFASENWHATRFSDATRFGVWYGSMEMETTLYETVFHWSRFVKASFADYSQEVRAERRIFTARCDALLIDLRGKQKRFPQLVDKESYQYTAQVGEYLYTQNQNGLLNQSARTPENIGVNGAIFRPTVLSDVKDRCFLTYRWTPASTTVIIEREANTTLTEVDLNRF